VVALGESMSDAFQESWMRTASVLSLCKPEELEIKNLIPDFGFRNLNTQNMDSCPVVLNTRFHKGA
jgi:hypothetical protein